MHNNQKGLTLIEVLIATTIAAIIGTVITVALSQSVSVSWAGHKRMEAIKQVENALYLINRDAQSAVSINTGASGYWLALSLSDNSTITYRIVEPGGTAPVYLQRNQGSTSSTVARYIDTGTGLSTCTYDGNLLDVKLTSTLKGLGSASETRRIMIYPRLNISN
jgi:prepilin-type N-terminal cleavage/methylation domain-containing protein